MDHGVAASGNALASKRRCTEAARDGSVVDDGDVLACDLLSQFASEKRGAAIDGVASDRVENLAEKLTRSLLVEDDGDACGGDLFCSDATKSALRGDSA